MALSGTAASGKYDGAHFLFSWTGKKMTTPGQTKIDWAIYRKGRTTSLYWYSNGYNIEIFANGIVKKTLTRTWQSATDRPLKEEDDSFRDSKNFVVASGSFIAVHDVNGKATIKVNFETIQIYSSTNIGGQSKTFSLDTNYPYTNCKAPTTFSALVKNTNRGTIKPDGKESIHLSWDGASGGIENPIKGYNIYCRITAAGTAPTFKDTPILATLSEDATWYDVTQESLKEMMQQIGLEEVRGQKIVFGINAYGIENYGSDMKVANAMIVNSLPGAPLIQNWAEENIVASTTETVAFNVTPGKDAQSNQELGIYYRTSPMDNYRVYTSETVEIVQRENSFEFVTFDGLEYGEATIVKIIKNSKPEIVLNIESKNLNDEINPYCLSLKATAQPREGQSGKDTYTYILKYSSNKEEWKSKEIRESSSQVFLIDDIRSFIEPNTQADYYYKIACKRHDSIEASDVVESPDIFYITKVPTNWNITGTVENLENYFSTKIKISSDQFDIGYQNLLVQIMSISDNSIITTEKIVIAQDGTASLGATSLQPGYQYKFQVASAGSEYYQYTLNNEDIQTTTLTKILSARDDLIANWGGILNPFVSNDVGQNIVLTNFLKDYEPEEYGFVDLPSFTITVKNGENQSQLSNFVMAIEENGDNANILLTGKQIFDLFYGENNILNLNVRDTTGQMVQVELEAVNLFGDKYVYRLNKEVNFAIDAPASRLNNDLTISCINDDLINIYREGQIWQVEAEYFSYYGAPKDIWLELISVESGKENDETAATKATILLKDSQGFSVAEKTGIAYGMPASFDLILHLEAIPKIEEERVVKQVLVKGIDGIDADFSFSRIEEDNFAILRKCVNPAIVLSNGRYEQQTEDENGDWAIVVDASRSYGIEDSVEQAKIVWDYQYLEDDRWQSADRTFEGNQLIAEVGEKQDWQFKVIRLSGTYTYTLKNGVTVTKVGISNELIIYNSLPTISYRRNQLGINYKIPPSNQAQEGLLKKSALIVGEHSEKRYIAILGSGTGSGSEVYVDIQTGQLLYFTIDGGSWD